MKLLGTRFQGYIAETWVMYQLAKRKIYTTRMDGNFYDYDLLCDNNVRLEIKSSTINEKHNQWRFGILKNSRNDNRTERDCDFYVLCGFENIDNITVFIIPEKELRNKKRLDLSINTEKYLKWKNRWDLITNFGEKIWGNFVNNKD